MTLFLELPVMQWVVRWYYRVQRSQGIVKLQALYLISFPSSIHHLALSLSRAPFTQTASQGLRMAQVHPLITSTNDLQNTRSDLLVPSSIPISFRAHTSKSIQMSFRLFPCALFL